MSEIPKKVEGRKYRLEGFLFPETYEVYTGATEEEIIRKMLQQFELELEQAKAKLAEQNENWEEQLQSKGLTLYDVITLASIVEREAVLDEERFIISGVFHNRIEDGWLLQSCATVQYILEKQRDRILLKDLEVDNPFNTYIYKGLPPGPIAAPGYKSILAALNPKEHDFYFFVTKKDGSGSHYFSQTFAEHKNKDAKSRGNF